MLIIHEIEGDAFVDQLEYSYILGMIIKIHVEVRQILHSVAVFLLHTGIFRYHYAAVKVSLIKVLGK